jgi:hypothetical protein
MQEAGNVEGEEQPVFIEEIERGHRIPRAQVDGAGRAESQRLDGNGERGRKGGPAREAIKKGALYGRRRGLGRRRDSVWLRCGWG